MLRRADVSRFAIQFCIGWFVAACLACNSWRAWGADEARIQILVRDEDDRPLPSRVHLLDGAGKGMRGTNLPYWKDHFVCPGDAEAVVPAGRYSLQVERGPEYERYSAEVGVTANAAPRILVRLRRIANMAAEGWFCGDLHLHRPVDDVPLLMEAEDLDVAPVITWWNNRNLWSDRDVPSEPAHRLEGDRFYNVMAGEDEREGGALLFFHLQRPLPISGASREYPSPMKFVEMARQTKGSWIDVEKPFWWDVPLWLACADVDSIGIANNHMCRSSMYESEAWGKPRDSERLPAPRGTGYWSQEIYYHVLNSGLRIPPSAGSASGVLPNPVGYNRVYVHAGPKKTLAGEADWWAGLKQGRSFVTNGPLLVVEADRQLPGHVFQKAQGESLSIPLRALVWSNEDLDAIEIVRNGEVVQTKSLRDKSREMRRAAKSREPLIVDLGDLTFDSSGWFLVRVFTDNPRTFRFASSAPYYVEIGEAPRRVSRRSAQFFLDWVNERAERVKQKLSDPERLREVLSYHDRAREFWRHRLEEANAD